jgi:3D (Asp-Asp-Asp) domain-containing protein
MKRFSGITFPIKIRSGLWSLLILLLFYSTSCRDENLQFMEEGDNLAIDSLVATTTVAEIWEEVYITAYTRGENLNFQWMTNHGTMIGTDSQTVKYWACPSCTGINTVVCIASNDYGSVSDTILIRVLPSN